MKRLSYEDIPDLKVGTVLIYREYKLDRYERRELITEYLNLPVYMVVPPDTDLNREELEVIFGRDLDTEDYLALSHSNTYRIVLKYTDANTNRSTYYTINMIKYFMENQQQNLFTVIEEPKTDIPNYNRILGFKDYDYGGLKNEKPNYPR